MTIETVKARKIKGRRAALIFLSCTLYALHADSNLDTETIYRSLKTNPELERKAMSVAEKLKAEGVLIGMILTLQDFLGTPSRSRRALEGLPVAQLEALHAELQREYEIRFKGK